MTTRFDMQQARDEAKMAENAMDAAQARFDADFTQANCAAVGAAKKAFDRAVAKCVRVEDAFWTEKQAEWDREAMAA